MKKRGFGKIELILILIMFILIIFAIYIQFFYVEKCENFECFKNSMEKCKKNGYINDVGEASWGYKIKGISGDYCEVEVNLLMAKGGQLEIDALTGLSMNCFYPNGVSSYPEKDLRACHGRLKEELQAIIIKKLHTHIIENLGEINETLTKAI